MGGELLVHFAVGLPDHARKSSHTAIGAQEMLHIPQIGVSKVRVPAGLEDKFLDLYSKLPNVLYAEKNILGSVDFVPNDPYYPPNSFTPSHKDDDSLNTVAPIQTIGQWGLDKIGGPNAWDTINSMTSYTVVAVIDSGVDSGHPDFSSKLVSGYDFVNNDSNPNDEYGHGTHVAGIVGAVTNNQTGVASIGHKAVRVMPLKVIDVNGATTADRVAQAVVWAANNGARIINMSLGFDTYSHSLQKAINYAWSTKGVLLVATAGNKGTTQLRYPGFSVWVLSAAATTQSDTKASFSNYGKTVGISAPGVNILSTMPRYVVTQNVTWSFNLDYDGQSGTSQAAPMVSGVAGVLRALSSGSTNLTILQRLQRSAAKVDDAPSNGGRSDRVGFGRLNASAAIAQTYRTASVGGVYGQVVDSSGNPDDAATITITNGYSVVKIGSGHFRFDNIPPGSYTVSATTANYVRSAQVTVVAGADTRVILGPIVTTYP